MPARKRKAKQVEKEEVKTTKRGRRIKKVNYQTSFSDSSSSEERIPNKKRKISEESDQEFQIDVDKDQSSSESIYSEHPENSEPEVASLNSEPPIEETKRRVKGGNKGKNKKANTSVHPSEHRHQSSSLIPSTLYNPMAEKKSPPIPEDEMDEIDGHKIPDFIKKGFIRDRNLKRPDDVGYDPSTLDIPKEMYDKLTPMMKQYWDIKKDHYDSVVLWRRGNWYIVYYYDVFILNSLVEKNPRTFHSEPGFFHSRLDFYISEFIKRGYKVVKVDQTETHDQLKKRVEEKKKKGKKVSKEGVSDN